MKKPPAPTEAVIHKNFPEVNAFVYLTIDEKQEFLPIESIASSSFAIRCPQHVAVGDKASFSYSTGTSKFQFEAACSQIADQTATFVKPHDVVLVGKFTDRRGAFRIKCALPVLFRPAPNGAETAELVETSIADLSIAGASLLLPSEPKEDDCVEITLSLNGRDKPFTVFGSIVRAGQELASGRFLAGLTFQTLSEEHSKAIDNFMVLYQRELRDRSLAAHGE